MRNAILWMILFMIFLNMLSWRTSIFLYKLYCSWCGCLLNNADRRMIYAPVLRFCIITPPCLFWAYYSTSLMIIIQPSHYGIRDKRMYSWVGWQDSRCSCAGAVSLKTGWTCSVNEHLLFFQPQYIFLMKDSHETYRKTFWNTIDNPWKYLAQW